MRLWVGKPQIKNAHILNLVAMMVAIYDCAKLDLLQLPFNMHAHTHTQQPPFNWSKSHKTFAAVHSVGMDKSIWNFLNLYGKYIWYSLVGWKKKNNNNRQVMKEFSYMRNYSYFPIILTWWNWNEEKFRKPINEQTNQLLNTSLVGITN